MVLVSCAPGSSSPPDQRQPDAEVRDAEVRDAEAADVQARDAEAGPPDDAGFEADANLTPDAQMQPTRDAAEPIETEVVHVQGDAARPTTCEQTCATQSTQCDRVCSAGSSSELGVGTAVYTFTFPNGGTDRGWYYPTMCREAVQPTRLFHAETYTLTSYECCCLAPRATRIEDNAAAPVSCAAACAAVQRACHPNTYWAGYGFAASNSTYRRVSDRALIAALEDCSQVPPLTRMSQGSEERLLSHWCGCL